MIEIRTAENGGFILSFKYNDFGPTLGSLTPKVKEYVFVKFEDLIAKLREVFPDAV